MAKKRAKARSPKGPSERPKASQPKVSRKDAHPFFCFKHIDKSTKQSYGFVLSAAESKEILDFACDMAQHSWTAIEQMTTGGKNGHRSHHEQSIEDIEKCARDDLTRRELDRTIGDGPLFRFRLGNKKRLWGFRSEQAFHVIWWDTNHDVYKLKKDKKRSALRRK